MKGYTEEQVEKIVDFLSVLYDPFDGECRGTGRSTLIAKAHIKIAMRNPQRKITIQDHNTNPRAIPYIMNIVADVLAEGENNMKEWYLGKDHIVYTPANRDAAYLINKFPSL